MGKVVPQGPFEIEEPFPKLSKSQMRINLSSSPPVNPTITDPKSTTSFPNLSNSSNPDTKTSNTPNVTETNHIDTPKTSTSSTPSTHPTPSTPLTPSSPAIHSSPPTPSIPSTSSPPLTNNTPDTPETTEPLEPLAPLEPLETPCSPSTQTHDIPLVTDTLPPSIPSITSTHDTESTPTISSTILPSTVNSSLLHPPFKSYLSTSGPNVGFSLSLPALLLSNNNACSSSLRVPDDAVRIDVLTSMVAQQKEYIKELENSQKKTLSVINNMEKHHHIELKNKKEAEESQRKKHQEEENSLRMQLADNNSKHTEEIHVLNQRIQNHINEHNKNEATIGEYKRKYASLEKSKHDAEERERKRIDQFNKKSNDYSILMEERNKLVAEQKKEEDKIRDLETEVSQLEVQMAANHSSEISNLRAEITRLRGENESMHHGHQAHLQECRKVHKDNITIIDKYKNALCGFFNRITNQSVTITNQSATINRLTSVNSEYSEKITRLRTELTKAKDDLSKAKSGIHLRVPHVVKRLFGSSGSYTHHNLQEMEKGSSQFSSRPTQHESVPMPNPNTILSHSDVLARTFRGDSPILPSGYYYQQPYQTHAEMATFSDPYQSQNQHHIHSHQNQQYHTQHHYGYQNQEQQQYSSPAALSPQLPKSPPLPPPPPSVPRPVSSLRASRSPDLISDVGRPDMRDSSISYCPAPPVIEKEVNSKEVVQPAVVLPPTLSAASLRPASPRLTSSYQKITIPCLCARNSKDIPKDFVRLMQNAGGYNKCRFSFQVQDAKDYQDKGKFAFVVAMCSTGRMDVKDRDLVGTLKSKGIENVVAIIFRRASATATIDEIQDPSLVSGIKGEKVVLQITFNKEGIHDTPNNKTNIEKALQLLNEVYKD